MKSTVYSVAKHSNRALKCLCSLALISITLIVLNSGFSKKLIAPFAETIWSMAVRLTSFSGLRMSSKTWYNSSNLFSQCSLGLKQKSSSTFWAKSASLSMQWRNDTVFSLLLEIIKKKYHNPFLINLRSCSAMFSSSLEPSNLTFLYKFSIWAHFSPQNFLCEISISSKYCLIVYLLLFWRSSLAIRLNYDWLFTRWQLSAILWFIRTILGFFYCFMQLSFRLCLVELWYKYSF